MQKSCIIFDLDGVLFKENRIKLLLKSGIYKTIRYLVTHRRNPIKIGFDIMHKMSIEEDTGNRKPNMYKHYIMPHCVGEWMRGVISNTILLEKIDAFIEKLKKRNYFLSSYELNFVQQAIRMILDEYQIPQYNEPIKPMIRLVNTLKQEGKHRLFILSNYAKKASDLLIQNHQDFFSLFEDIIISANIGMIKPEQEIYKHLIGKHALTPQECLFVDDTKANIASAQKLGITGIHFEKYKSLENTLRQLQILQ